jgi:hypothetical protein
MRALALVISAATASSLPRTTSAAATCSETPSRAGDRLLFVAGTLTHKVDKVGIGQHRGIGQDGECHRFDVARQPQRNVMRQMFGAPQAVRQRTPHRQLDVLRHDPDDVLGDLKFGFGQRCAIDLARQLVRHLGAHRGGRLRQQPCNVGLRKGGRHGASVRANP